MGPSRPLIDLDLRLAPPDPEPEPEPEPEPDPEADLGFDLFAPIQPQGLRDIATNIHLFLKPSQDLEKTTQEATTMYGVKRQIGQIMAGLANDDFWLGSGIRAIRRYDHQQYSLRSLKKILRDLRRKGPNSQFFAQLRKNMTELLQDQRPR